MTTLCRCGHALSQHPERGRCDYDGYACRCPKPKYVRSKNGVITHGATLRRRSDGSGFDVILPEDSDLASRDPVV